MEWLSAEQLLRQPFPYFHKFARADIWNGETLLGVKIDSRVARFPLFLSQLQLIQVLLQPKP
jgi:hypothetical protein